MPLARVWPIGGESFNKQTRPHRAADLGMALATARSQPGSQSPGQAPGTAPPGEPIEPPPGVAPVTTLPVQPGTLSEVTDLLVHLRLLMRHMVRQQKGGTRSPSSGPYR